MADLGDRQHQLTGEAALGARVSSQGVAWSTVGENIGEAGPIATTPTAAAVMAAAMTRSMLAEQAPDDGHRRNILNPAFHHVGISVVLDDAGVLWLTQDFSN